jgi:membrane protease YdiL (CAAX protease family)
VSRSIYSGVAVFCIVSFGFSWPVFFIVDCWWLPTLAAAGDSQQVKLVALFGHLFAMFGPFIGALTAFRLIHKTPFPRLRIGQQRYYVWAALAMFLVFTIPATLGLVFGKSIFLVKALDTFAITLLATTMILGWLAAMGEEAGWCLYLLSSLQTKWGKTRAIIFSGIVRGIWHWPVLTGIFMYQAVNGDIALGELALRSLGIAIQLMVSNVFFGALFGWLWYKTESLPLLGWMHICYDVARDTSFVLVIGFQASAFFPLWAIPFNIVAFVLLMGIARREGVTFKNLFSRPSNT